MKRLIISMVVFVSLSSAYLLKEPEHYAEDSGIISHVVDPKIQEIRFFWKNKNGENYSNFARLKASLNEQKEELVFAMNGGMYKEDQSPLGLYIENGKILAPLNATKKGYGNFYLQPNGIFYITKDNIPTVCTTDSFQHSDKIKFATQSGPMLVVDGQIHPKFQDGSVNLNIRNGVGILPDGKVLFAMSKDKINLYDFASYFKKQGCRNALYLDGFVSKTYLPEEHWEQLDGNLGVLIGEIKKL